jgi:inorganic pyrophosphatase
MNMDNISVGKDVPNQINVIIEIPAHGGPIKYEVDKDSGALLVDRFMGTAMYYPANYGFVPHTLSDDGDPVDVLVVTPVPLAAGSVIACRPVGVLKMTDEAGADAKVVAVPIDKLTPLYKDVQNVKDLPESLLNAIHHFFEQYKANEAGKWVKVDGWADVEAAKAEIAASVERYNAG